MRIWGQNLQPVPSAGKQITRVKRGKTCNGCRAREIMLAVPSAGKRNRSRAGKQRQKNATFLWLVGACDATFLSQLESSENLESRETRDDLGILYRSMITVPIFIPTIVKLIYLQLNFYVTRWRIFFASIPSYPNSNIEIPNVVANHSPCFIVDVLLFKRRFQV